MKAKRKIYENGGQTTPKKKVYKDATGTYTLGIHGQKIYDGIPSKKPATPAAKPPSKPAAKSTGAAKTQTRPPLTEGESFGSKIQSGDYAGAAGMVGEAFVNAPSELYRALKRSMRDLK